MSAVGLNRLQVQEPSQLIFWLGRWESKSFGRTIILSLFAKRLGSPSCNTFHSKQSHIIHFGSYIHFTTYCGQCLFLLLPCSLLQISILASVHIFNLERTGHDIIRLLFCQVACISTAHTVNKQQFQGLAALSERLLVSSFL